MAICEKQKPRIRYTYAGDRLLLLSRLRYEETLIPDFGGKGSYSLSVGCASARIFVLGFRKVHCTFHVAKLWACCTALFNRA